MTVLLLIISVTSWVTQNCIFNKVSKNDLKSNHQIYYFNSIISFVCLVIFGLLLLNGKISVFTALLGTIFGIMIALGNIYCMLALANGPMNVTVLITTSSTIIPALSGVFFGEKFSLTKLVLVLVLMVFIFLSLEKSNDLKINMKWVLFVSLAFVTQGVIGVLQKTHQMSDHKDEATGFLFMAFIVAYIYNRIRAREKVKNLNLKRSSILFGMICGLCTFCMHYLNLKLSGMMPSQIFFPLANGSSMILTQIMSVVLFHEIPTKKQIVGLSGGICTLIVMCTI